LCAGFFVWVLRPAHDYVSRDDQLHNFQTLLRRTRCLYRVSIPTFITEEDDFQPPLDLLDPTVINLGMSVVKVFPLMNHTLNLSGRAFYGVMPLCSSWPDTVLLSVENWCRDMSSLLVKNVVPAGIYVREGVDFNEFGNQPFPSRTFVREQSPKCELSVSI
jgi:hypothetical protein